MSVLGFRAFTKFYRSFTSVASNHSKLVSRRNFNMQLKANFLKHCCNKSTGGEMGLATQGGSGTEVAPKRVTVTFKKLDGTLVKRSGKVGETVRQTVGEIDNDLPFYGYCLGRMACLMCHVVLTQEDFDKLPEPCENEEIKLLSLPTTMLAPTSRLGCCIELRPEIDGIVLLVPLYPA